MKERASEVTARQGRPATSPSRSRVESVTEYKHEACGLQPFLCQPVSNWCRRVSRNEPLIAQVRPALLHEQDPGADWSM